MRRAAPRRLVGAVVDGARLAEAPPLKADRLDALVGALFGHRARRAAEVRLVRVRVRIRARARARARATVRVRVRARVRVRVGVRVRVRDRARARVRVRVRVWG